jgi:RimJ/RimL family protein N-acetyltransferase
VIPGQACVAVLAGLGRVVSLSMQSTKPGVRERNEGQCAHCNVFGYGQTAGGTMTPLETDRLLLRLMQADDFDALHQIFTDPKVMASFGGELLTADQMLAWLRRNLDHQEQFGYGLFAVVRKADSMLIGDCGLEHMMIEGHPAAELGYDFRSDAWNQGFATEAACAVRDYAFQSHPCGELGLPSRS